MSSLSVCFQGEIRKIFMGKLILSGQHYTCGWILKPD